jgi:hypothetical protein
MYVQCIAESINIMGTRIGRAMKERDSRPIWMGGQDAQCDGYFRAAGISRGRAAGVKRLRT